METLFEWIGDKYSQENIDASLNIMEEKKREREICCLWYIDNAEDKRDNIIYALLLH